MLEGSSLGNYLLLVEFTGRLFRDGKPNEPPELLIQPTTRHRHSGLPIPIRSHATPTAAVQLMARIS